MDYHPLPDNILLSHNPKTDLQSFLLKQRYSKVIVLVDENTRRFCYPIIEQALPPHVCIEIKSGEEQKILATCSTIWQAMTDEALDRHAAMIVLGGGVLGDMGGFCAATYKRGIDFILVATTLLAQADASIGGKLAVDFNHFKNHIGVFQLPALTLLYSGFFKTLPVGELRSGFAEVIKHALISDKTMWDEIRQKNLDEQDWDKLVLHSVKYKSYVVTEDPKEKGLRKILNAGHTIGHAIESYLLAANRKVLHGEAIAAGLIAESRIAVDRGFLDEKSFTEITTYLLKIFGKINLQPNELDDITKLTVQDKKNKENKILCVLLDGIGNAKLDCEISLAEVKNALSFYQSL
jgi:3-dehydroquinate synthase